MAGLNLPKRGVIGPASILKRATAFLADILLINIIIVGPFKRLFNSLIPENSIKEAYGFVYNNPETANILWSMFVFIGIMAVLYFTIFEYKTKQTPGKMLMNIYVKADKENFWSYLFSNVTFIPIFPFVLMWIIDPIYMFINQDNQRFMEKINNIKVLEEYSI